MTTCLLLAFRCRNFHSLRGASHPRALADVAFSPSLFDNFASPGSVLGKSPISGSPSENWAGYLHHSIFAHPIHSDPYHKLGLLRRLTCFFNEIRNSVLPGSDCDRPSICHGVCLPLITRLGRRDGQLLNHFGSFVPSVINYLGVRP